MTTRIYEWSTSNVCSQDSTIPKWSVHLTFSNLITSKVFDISNAVNFGFLKIHQYYLGRTGLGSEAKRRNLGLEGNNFCCGPLVVYSQAAVSSKNPLTFSLKHFIQWATIFRRIVSAPWYLSRRQDEWPWGHRNWSMCVQTPQDPVWNQHEQRSIH